MAGLACAGPLARAGHRVTVIDKGRGPGGRMASRRAEVGGRTLAFDHGAQYFTARDPAFRAEVAAWEAAGVVARWDAAGAEAWVGTPGMNAPIRAMAEGLDVRWGVRAEVLRRDGAVWRVRAGKAAFARLPPISCSSRFRPNRRACCWRSPPPALPRLPPR